MRWTMHVVVSCLVISATLISPAFAYHPHRGDGVPFEGLLPFIIGAVAVVFLVAYLGRKRKKRKRKHKRF